MSQNIQVILSAFTAGAQALAQQVALPELSPVETIRTYGLLKAHILVALSDDPAGELVVRKFERAPQVWCKALEQVLVDAEIDRSPEALALARDVLSRLEAG